MAYSVLESLYEMTGAVTSATTGSADRLDVVSRSTWYLVAASRLVHVTTTSVSASCCVAETSCTWPGGVRDGGGAGTPGLPFGVNGRDLVLVPGCGLGCGVGVGMAALELRVAGDAPASCPVRLAETLRRNTL